MVVELEMQFITFYYVGLFESAGAREYASRGKGLLKTNQISRADQSLQTNHVMVYTLFQVHTLKFNRKDYDTLSLFYLNRGYYNELLRNSECQAERQLYDAYFHRHLL